MENRLRRADINLTAASATKQLRRLHSCLHWTTSRSKASRLLEEPTETQSRIPRAFGYKKEDGALRKLADQYIDSANFFDYCSVDAPKLLFEFACVSSAKLGGGQPSAAVSYSTTFSIISKVIPCTRNTG